MLGFNPQTVHLVVSHCSYAGRMFQWKRREGKRVRKLTRNILLRLCSKFAFQIKTSHRNTQINTHLSFILALDSRGCWMPLRGHSTPEKKSRTHCTVWDLGLSWTAAENLVQAGIESTDIPACSEPVFLCREYVSLEEKRGEESE